MRERLVFRWELKRPRGIICGGQELLADYSLRAAPPSGTGVKVSSHLLCAGSGVVTGVSCSFFKRTCERPQNKCALEAKVRAYLCRCWFAVSVCLSVSWCLVRVLLSLWSHRRLFAALCRLFALSSFVSLVCSVPSCSVCVCLCRVSLLFSVSVFCFWLVGSLRLFWLSLTLLVLSVSFGSLMLSLVLSVPRARFVSFRSFRLLVYRSLLFWPALSLCLSLSSVSGSLALSVSRRRSACGQASLSCSVGRALALVVSLFSLFLRVSLFLTVSPWRSRDPALTSCLRRRVDVGRGRLDGALPGP